MTTWRFSDETTVELGGNVEGASLFAQDLRATLADPPNSVVLWRLPTGGVELDVNDVALLDKWLRDYMTRPRYRSLKLRLVEVPENIPALPEQPARDPNAIQPSESALY